MKIISQVRSDDDDEDTSTTKCNKTWGPSSMSHQRERGFLPAFPQERSLNLVKSAPNLDNKSRSSSSTDNILLGNRADLSDRMTVVKSTTSMNSLNYTNTNYHSIFYERDLIKANDNHNEDERKEASMTSIRSHNNNSNESFEYDSDDSVSNSVSGGCFSFVGNSSSTDSKKAKSRYKKFGKSHTTDLDNRQLLSQTSKTERKPKASSSRKNSADPKKKIQFEELTPKAKFNVDLTFYTRFEQSLEAVGSHEMGLSEEDAVYVRTKPKNKLAMRLQKSLDAIDSFDVDEESEERHEKVYSKSIDDLSTGSDYQWYRAGSQFTRQCFFRNGSARNGNQDSESSQESTARKSSWPHPQY